MEQKIELRGKAITTYFEQLDGAETTIVFLHDSLGSIELWRDFPQKLAQLTQCNIFLYDRIGYGKSAAMDTHSRENNYMEIEADILNELLLAANLKNVILFGHSDGGTIALLAASKYPATIKACIVEAAHIFVEDVTLAGIHEAIKAFHETNLPERLAKYHGNKVETIFKAWTETWTNPSYRNWNIEHFLPKIHCPLLFIQGENDEYGSLEQVLKTVEQVKGYSEKCIIEKIGHTPHKEAPNETLQAAGRFILKIKNQEIS